MSARALVFAGFSACHPSATPVRSDDPLDIEAKTSREVLVRITARVAKATPEGVSLVMKPDETANPGSQLLVAVAETSEAGWLRIVIELLKVRIAVWVPRTDLEFLPPARGTSALSLSLPLDPIVSDTDHVVLPRGTRLFDVPHGSTFGVTTLQASFPILGEKDDHVQLRFASPWGDMSAWAEAPYTVVRGARG